MAEADIPVQALSVLRDDADFRFRQGRPLSLLTASRACRSIGVKELDHSLAERIADKEIRLRVSELMMAVAGIRRIFGFADEIVRLDEEHVASELGTCRCRRLGLAQRGPLARGLHPRAGQLTDDDRQVRRVQFLAHVLDEVHQVGFVFRHGRLRLAAVVPSLIPYEAAEFVAAAVIAGEIGLQIRQRLANFRDHLRVVRTYLAARARRAEILVQALAAPRGLDDQDLIVEVVADDPAELQLRAKVMLVAVDGEAHGQRTAQQRPVLAPVTHPHVVPHDPLPLAS